MTGAGTGESAGEGGITRPETSPGQGLLSGSWDHRGRDFPVGPGAQEETQPTPVMPQGGEEGDK